MVTETKTLLDNIRTIHAQEEEVSFEIDHSTWSRDLQTKYKGIDDNNYNSDIKQALTIEIERELIIECNKILDSNHTDVDLKEIAEKLGVTENKKKNKIGLKEHLEELRQDNLSKSRKLEDRVLNQIRTTSLIKIREATTPKEKADATLELINIVRAISPDLREHKAPGEQFDASEFLQILCNAFYKKPLAYFTSQLSPDDTSAFFDLPRLKRETLKLCPLPISQTNPKSPISKTITSQHKVDALFIRRDRYSEELTEATRTEFLEVDEETTEFPILLKRFTNANKKITTEVPADKLTLKVKPKNSEAESFEQREFEATAFILHGGDTLNTGHYTTYVKVNKNAQENWLCYNDDHEVEYLTEEEAQKKMASAYVIKYSKPGLLPDAPEKPIGIKNLGNTCWASAAIMFLDSFTSLNKTLDQKAPVLIVKYPPANPHTAAENAKFVESTFQNYPEEAKKLAMVYFSNSTQEKLKSDSEVSKWGEELMAALNNYLIADEQALGTLKLEIFPELLQRAQELGLSDDSQQHETLPPPPSLVSRKNPVNTNTQATTPIPAQPPLPPTPPILSSNDQSPYFGYSMFDTLSEIDTTLNPITQPQSTPTDDLKLTTINLTEGEIILSTTKPLNDEGAKRIADFIKQNTSLTKLSFKGGEINETQIATIFNTLRDNTSLKELDLSTTKISDGGAKKIAELIRNNTFLITLDLDENQIGKKTIGDIKKILERNKNSAIDLEEVRIELSDSESAVQDSNDSNLEIVNAAEFGLLKDQTTFTLEEVAQYKLRTAFDEFAATKAKFEAQKKGAPLTSMEIEEIKKNLFEAVQKKKVLTSKRTEEPMLRELTEYSVRGILAKAEKDEKKKFAETSFTETSKIEITFGERYERTSFRGKDTTNEQSKADFGGDSFGNNSFANCNFYNCKFGDEKTNPLKYTKFANCTFDKNVKFSAGFIERIKKSKVTFSNCTLHPEIIKDACKKLYGKDYSNTDNETKTKLGNFFNLSREVLLALDEASNDKALTTAKTQFISKADKKNPSYTPTPIAAFRLTPDHKLVRE